MAFKKCRICEQIKPLEKYEKHRNGYRSECKACHSLAQRQRTQNKLEATKNTILVIPDTHAPYHHKDTIAFLKEVARVYSPTRVIHLGDEIDNHAISFHESDPDLMSAGEELKAAVEFIQELAAIFPKMDLLDSNHGSLAYRRGKFHGIPRGMLKGYHEVLNAPFTWHWHFELVVDGILFCHGDGKKADALRASQDEACSIVMGHHHSRFCAQFWQTNREVFFGVNGGCLIDDRSLAFAYNKKSSKRPMLGCTVIANGHPLLIRMKVDEGGRWIGEL